MYKVLDVSRYIINYSNKKGYGISNLKLQKVLYFVQAYYLVEKNGCCFEEKIEAWNFGPVIPVVYREFKHCGGCNIPRITYYFQRINVGDSFHIGVAKYSENVLRRSDRTIIGKIVDAFSRYSATSLVKITHSQQPWIEAYNRGASSEIYTEDIKEFFKCQKAMVMKATTK